MTLEEYIINYKPQVFKFNTSKREHLTRGIKNIIK